MKTLTATVSGKNEMDVRRIALLVQTASSFESEIYLSYDERRMNAKSLMGTMTLCLKSGAAVDITANGRDEEKALEAMRAFLED